MSDLIIHSAEQLLTIAGTAPKRGAEQSELGIIQDGAVAVRDGVIVAVGPSDEIRALATPGTELVDARGCVVLPGFVDAHTHVVFAGDRANEFEMRLEGAAYLDIMKAGGGIMSTVRKTRAASREQLAAETRARLDRMLAYGTTTVEAKTGYGLDTATELRMLEVIALLQASHTMDLAPTFIGAHAIPTEYAGRGDEFVELVVEEMLPRVAEKKSRQKAESSRQKAEGSGQGEEGSRGVAGSREQGEGESRQKAESSRGVAGSREQGEGESRQKAEGSGQGEEGSRGVAGSREQGEGESRQKAESSRQKAEGSGQGEEGSRGVAGSREQGTGIFCDVFCDEGAFTLEQSRRILERAKSLGMPLKIHADEFANLGGAALAAELGAVSADHLMVTRRDEMRLMAQAGVIAVLLPGTTFGLGKHDFADGRAFVEENVPVALGTDLNPGTSWCESMPMAMAIATRYEKLTTAQAIVAATLNAAYASGMGERVGSLEVGKQGDIIIAAVPDYRYLTYRYGTNPIRTVVKRGRVVHTAPNSLSL